MTTRTSRFPALDRRPRLRLSLRTLMSLILVIALALGWIIQRAEVQRKAVADLERAGFSLTFRWGWSETRFDPSVKNPQWLQWLIDRLGPDYFRDVEFLGDARNPAPIVDDHLMAQIGRLSKLERIIFNDTEGLTDERMAFLSNLTGLKEFYANADIHGAGLMHFKRMRNLQILSLGSITDQDMPQIAPMKSLRLLRLGESSGLTDAGMAHLRGLTKLQSLDFHNASRVTTAGLNSLRDMKDLFWIDLNHCGVRSLEPIRHLSNLRVLGLSGCPIDDDGLAAVTCFKKLETLRLRTDRISDEGLRHLKNLPSLVSLELKTAKVTDAGVAQLKLRLPKIYVTQ